MDSMEIIWIPCGETGFEFREYIWAAKDKAQLKNIEGKNRWTVIGDDGIERIVRPMNKSTESHWCSVDKS